MRRPWLAVGAGVLVGALLVLVAVVGWREVTDARSPRITAEVCDVDPTLSGFQGWCVQRRVRPAGLVTDPVAEIWIVGIQDGGELPRYTYLPLPTTVVDGRFEVTFTVDGIEVRLDDDVSVLIPEAHYQLD